MNKPDKAGEPSIEEILASIRQKNAEGAEAPRSADGASAEAPSDQPSSANGSEAPRGTPPALLDRLKGMGQGEAAAGREGHAGALNGARRSLSFDQDLADMFDEPDTGEPLSAAPKPEMRATPRLGGFPSAPSSEVNGSRAPSSAPSSSSAPGVSSDAAGSSASAPPPRPPSYGFPPLTKQGGFYPRSEPQLPPISGAGDANASPASSEGGTGAGGNATASSSSSSFPASGPSQRFSDLGSFIPSDTAGGGVHTPRSSFGAPPLAGSGKDSLSASPEAKGVAHAIPEVDAGGSAPGDDLSASQGTASSAPADSASFRQDADRASSDREATQALDALAMGLAASSAKADTGQPYNPPPDGVLKPVTDTPAAGDPRHAVVAQDTQASAPSSRSLEDVVADMLKPMLQRWVQENMPRIMEKALRSEMQRTLGPGGKPPGSAS